VRDKEIYAVSIADVNDQDSLTSIYGSPEYFPEDISFHPDAKSVMFPGYGSDRSKATLLVVERNERKPELPSLPFLTVLRNLNISGVDSSPDGNTIAFTATAPPQSIEWPLE
jgi:hypothetical protein